MPVTRSPGITVDAAGRRIIDKEFRGVRIYRRLGNVSDAEAEHRLSVELEHIDSELQRKSNARPRFSDGAARYLEESQDLRTADVTAWHVRLLLRLV